MKKLSLLVIGVLSMSNLVAQDISDAVRYSLDEIQGSARFRSMSGAFGALGGDMSAVSINPAGSSIFNESHASISLSNFNVNNDVNYFNGFSSSSNSNIDLNQTGAAFVFRNTNQNSPWRKFVISVAYDKVSDFDNDWFASGTNTNSIDSYFLAYAQGLRLDEISALPGESLSDAYSEIGSFYGFGNQQAFLGYESYILEPDSDTDDNTTYFSNIAPGNFDQEYSYAARGYNGKFAFNISSQFKDNLYIGLNLNSHFINYEKSTFLKETNSNAGSIVNEVRFQNNLATTGSGFSFQLGAIAKLSEEFRAGLTYNSPTWYTIAEETTQYLATVRDDAGTNVTQIIDPFVVNIFPEYKLQTPGKLTGSLAYVFGEQGLISFDYSRKDYGSTKFKPTSDPYFASQNNFMSDNLKIASTYRLGGEYRYKQLSFRGGYRMEESPYKNDSFYGDLKGFSLGLGYNFGNTKLDLAFDQSDRNVNNQLYSVGLTDAASIDTKNTNVTLSLAFTL
jgi:long-subunit fatty acid transport protein